MNKYIQTTTNLMKAMESMESGYGMEALEGFVLGYIRGRKRVKEALKNIKVEE